MAEGGVAVGAPRSSLVGGDVCTGVSEVRLESYKQVIS